MENKNAGKPKMSYEQAYQIALEEKIKKIEYIRMVASMEPVSISTPIGDDDGDSDTELGSMIASTEPGPDEIAQKTLMADYIKSLVKRLDPRGQKVLELRFGLYDGRERTLEEVGKMFGVTRERVRQIEAKSIRKLKHIMIRKGYRSMSDF